MNSWNIKDPIQYKLDLQENYDPDFWQWMQADQIIYNQNVCIFFDQEVIKTFSQDQERLAFNKKQGNMNRNAAKRRKGQHAQGNKIYLSLWHYPSRTCIKLPIDFSSSELELDADSDKLIFIYQRGDVSVFAIYDTSRIVFIQIDESHLFEEEATVRHSLMTSQLSRPSKHKSFIGAASVANDLPKKQFLKTKVIFFEDILEPDRAEGDQTDFENIVQKVEIVGGKIYLWNENMFRVLEIKYSVDLDALVDE